jgi:hypothetical protein
MRRTGLLLAALTAVIVASMVIGGCANQSTTTGTTTKPAVDQQQVQEKVAAANEALKTAKTKIGQLSAGLAALDAATSGLQINATVSEISTKLDAAINATADKKQTAIAEVTTALNDLTMKVDAAAAKLPAGGPVRTKLESFSAKLKDVQTNLDAAAASSATSSTP